MEIVSGLDAVSRVALSGTEDLGDIDEIPRLDVIVLGLPPVDVSFNSVALVANNEAMAIAKLVVKQMLTEGSGLT